MERESYFRMNRRILNVVGARPNFIKIAPIHRRMQAVQGLEPLLIHTGQHYDEKMSKTFFIDLEMPEPDIYLGVGSGSHAVQTGAILVEMEKICIEYKPDLIVVVGDVNSTLAAALAAVKLNIPVAHVEAGLRSFDRTMPEEINRLMTDAVCEMLFVTEQSGIDNLKHEGVDPAKIFFTGNVMIDSLVANLEKTADLNAYEPFNMKAGEYALMTMHRPSNVDNRDTLTCILSALEEIQKETPILFPIHPRTRKMISRFGMDERVKRMCNLTLTPPLGYLSFLNLMANARLLITDSGGIQEETTFLQIPCITLRENTERPVTIDLGTNTLVGMNPEQILQSYREAMNGSRRQSRIPPLWDGKAAERIVEIICQRNSNRNR